MSRFWEVIEWYHHEAPRLGDRFYQRVQSAMNVLQRNPFVGPVVEHEMRRFQLRPFPYTIYYGVTESSIRVMRIVHQHRHPDTWKG